MKYSSNAGQWAIGDLKCNGSTRFIDARKTGGLNEKWNMVHPETAGQYTGLKDVNKTMVFDGDILEAKLDDESGHITRVVVEWGGFGWQLHEPRRVPVDMTEDDIGIWKVVGNKWDNPELLEYADEDTAQYANMPVLMPAT